MIAISRVLLVTAGVLLILGALLGIHLSTTDLEYSRYNSGWNGTSALFSRLDAAGAAEVRGPADLERSNGTLLLIAPAGNVTPEDAAHYRSFLERGNTLLLAANRADANALLASLGSTIRVQEGPLLSIDAGFDTPAAVLAFPAANDTLTDTVSSLVLNTPAALEGGEPLFATTVFSWIDTNRDTRVNRNEEMRSHAVLCREAVGNGTLYVFGDPGFFLNAMAGLEGRDNLLLLERMLEASPLLVDQSHSATAAASGTILFLNLVRNTTLMKIALLLSLLILLAILARKNRWEQ